MPSFFTHYLCGDTMLGLLNDNAVSEKLLKYRQVFNLGTQGPDILFYYRVWPWTNSQGFEEIGEKMHSENVSAFFSSAIKYISTQDGDEKDLLTAYLCGYACHYSLDLNTHPYIFYRTGFVCRGEQPNSQYSCNHRNFETAVDVLTLDRLLGAKPFRMKAPDLLRVSSEEALSIGRMLEYVLGNVYVEIVSAKQVSTAISDMVAAVAILRSRSGFRKSILSFIEKSLHHYPLISSMIHPPAITDGRDYLNLSHKPWLLPWNRAKQSTASFPEMFDHAALEAGNICEALLGCLSNPENTSATLELIGNRSFLTGIDCTINTEFKYYELDL